MRVFLIELTLSFFCLFISSLHASAQHPSKMPGIALDKIMKRNANFPPEPSGAQSGFKATETTLFWVGEKPGPDNGYIGNEGSYWDPDWVRHFGGVDSPRHRDGYFPARFTPNENPFYVALPFAEVDRDGKLKAIAKRIPGFGGTQTPLTKNRWIEIRYKGKSCYAQWQDVGPFGEDDFDWVFGDAVRPKNQRGEKAGLDVSPAVAAYLGIKDNDITEWRFVSESTVPEGPWRKIVTKG
jgi:hypothetical protein